MLRIYICCYAVNENCSKKKSSKTKVKSLNLLLIDPRRIIEKQLGDEQVDIYIYFCKSCFRQFLHLNEFQFCT